MQNEMFLVILAVGLMFHLLWGFKVLPGERWQIMATIPVRKIDSVRWDGINLTYYGLFSANAYLISGAMMIVLLGAVGIDLNACFLLILIMLAFCLPMARIIAMIVEGKVHTRTVGGAVFAGLLIAPLTIALVNSATGPTTVIPMMPAMAALAASYALGEGMGRLACISFGCCYGRRLSECPPFLQSLFANYNFIFSGKMKKIAYESGLDGQRVVPVQAVTAGLYTATALASTYLFLNSHYAYSFLLSVLVTQGWRSVSEIFRADYRGKGRVSVYQIMGAVAISYALIFWKYCAESRAAAYVSDGIRILWQPGVIVFLLFVWLGIFLHTGCSKVTGSVVSFHVHENKI